MEEQWKPIEGHERYLISNFGKVYHSKLQKEVKGLITHKGYKQIVINENGKAISYRVHKLVATHFMTNINNLPQINHKDTNKLNNRVDNLEWCDNSINIRHAINNGLYQEYHTSLSKSIIGTHIETGEIIRFASMQEAQRNGFNVGNISLCTRGKRKSHLNFIWELE